MPTSNKTSRTERGRHFFGIVLPAVAVAVGAVVALAITLRVTGLLVPYQIPTGAMHPAIRIGDCVAVEGFTYLLGSPRRGDMIVFRTKDIPAIGNDEVYVKRLAGLPGDRLRITDGQLHVNGRPIVFPPAGAARVRYLNAGSFLRTPTDEIVVPPDNYFVLGDNSANSADSRYWGLVPKAAVQGKVWFRYWPWR